MVKGSLRTLALVLREAWSIAISEQRRRAALRTPLYANSVYLMANSAVTAALGFVFWVLVARFYPAEALGLGSALISAAALLAFVASLGLGTGLIRYLPGAGTGGVTLINSCFTLTGLAAVVVASIFVAGLQLWSPALAFVRQNPIFVASFMAFVVTSTLFSLLTGAIVALRLAQFVLIEGAPCRLGQDRTGCYPSQPVSGVRHLRLLGSGGSGSLGLRHSPLLAPSIARLPPVPGYAKQGSYQEGMLTRDVRRSLKLIVILLLPAIAVMLAGG